MAGHKDQWGWKSGMWMISYGLWSMIVLLIIGVLSLPIIRRRFFNLFYFAHFFVFIGLFFAWLHVPSDFYYMIPGIGLYVVDLGMRLYSFKRKLQVTDVVHEACGFLTVHVGGLDEHRGKNMRGGQYFFVNFPTVAKHEWHPFR
jgi:hypothetical protein